MLIQVLYDNLRDKSPVLTEKSVRNVEQYPGGVRVQTADGSVFTGELLVGADGIYSTVRKELWRQTDQARPGYFPLSDRTNLATEYCCIFGISKPNNKVPKFSSSNVMGRGYSYLIASGPNHRIYWFLFKKLTSRMYGIDKIPRYTEAERDELAAEHADDPLNEQLRFGELYANRTTATLQALPEVVFSKWHYGRVITIGDAAHKVCRPTLPCCLFIINKVVVQSYWRTRRQQRHRRRCSTNKSALQARSNCRARSSLE
jgi:2-polyprenyl-6-methoxyphenol hydroxylase-like FAD-dependent oxidoreductase